MAIRSERLRYEPLSTAHLEEFHRLVQDEHVRRYLMDGHVLPREWSEQRIHESVRLFNVRGVGLWMTYELGTADVVGFCGFIQIPSVHPEPQLVFAMFERFIGRGYATEMAGTSIAAARRHGFDAIVASVDEANAASRRVLAKLGFREVAAKPGRCGKLLVLVLDA